MVEPGVIGVKGVAELMPVDDVGKLRASAFGSVGKREQSGIREERKSKVLSTVSIQT